MFTLKDVLLVSSFLTIMVSVFQLTVHNNCEVSFTPSQYLFQDATIKQIGCGFSRGKLYYLHIKHLAVSKVEVFTLMSTAMQWHD